MADISKIIYTDIANISKVNSIEKANIANILGMTFPAEPGGGSRGLFGGGNNDATDYNIIDYVDITTPGNASDFGDLVSERAYVGGVSNSSNGRGIFAAGYDPDTGSPTGVIEYVTIATTGNTTDFGDLNSYDGYNLTQNVYSCSNGTNERGVFAGGSDYYNGGFWNHIQYITINTPGNASDFGNMLTDTQNTAGGTSNQTGERGVFSGGYNESEADTNVISYITINSAGNAIDFGDLTDEIYGGASVSNGTNNRGIHGGGWGSNTDDYTIISYITINSPGNASDFGDLVEGNDYLAATDNATGGYGIFGGGYSPYSDTIQRITIGTLGNSVDFGNLTQARRGLAAISNG